jgi:hypothetical protein
MTNEEAIALLNGVKNYYNDETEDSYVGFDDEDNEAIDTAIKALEKQCEDCVDKKELLKSIEVALNATNINDEYSIGLRNGMRLVKSFVDDKRPDYEKVSHMKKQQPYEDCISREEAIRVFADDDYTVNELRNLPSVTPQQQLCDDCISREETMQITRAWFDRNAKPSELKNEIEQMPSVTPHPKMGEWLEKEVISDKVIEEWQSARCSICDKYHTTPYMYYFSHYDYCPHCGAKMERRQKFDKRRSKRNR